MQKRLLLTVLLISLSGCNTTASKVAQVPAGQWVDEQIVQNATSLSRRRPGYTRPALCETLLPSRHRHRCQQKSRCLLSTLP